MTMTQKELRAWLFNEWFCHCGSPELAVRALRGLLALHPLFEPGRWEDLERFVPDEGVRLLVLYTLAQFDLTRHGGTVEGAWLSDKGHAVLAALNQEAADEFEALCQSCCIHGTPLTD